MVSKFSDKKLLELYTQGLTNREIALELQVSQAAVHYRLQKLGLVNNCHNELTADPEEVKMLHGMGLTNIGIALILRISVHTIGAHLKELGLKDNYYQLTEIVNYVKTELHR